jgi:hypothetical protein
VAVVVDDGVFKDDNGDGVADVEADDQLDPIFSKHSIDCTDNENTVRLVCSLWFWNY